MDPLPPPSLRLLPSQHLKTVVDRSVSFHSTVSGCVYNKEGLHYTSQITPIQPRPFCVEQQEKDSTDKNKKSPGYSDSY